MAHPLFATAVPVWFAATFALSSLAVRGAIIERWVLSSQLDLILPMATPPLGHTARFLIAALFGALGWLVGWTALRLLAPRAAVAQPHAARRSYADATYDGADHFRLREADAHPDAPARRPINAHAELGEHGFDYVAGESKQQAFVAPMSQPQPDAAPVYQPPFEAPQTFAPPAYVAPIAVAHAPLSHTDVPMPPQPIVTPVIAPPPLHSAHFPAAPVFTTVPPVAVFEPAQEKPAAGFPTPPQDGPSAADHIARAPVDSLSHVELIARLASAMERRREADVTMPQVPAPQDLVPQGNNALAPAPDGTGNALRAALNALREVK